LKTFIQRHTYLIFVLSLILVLGTVYLAKTDEPLISVQTHQQQLVRHEPGEDKLNAFEQYLEDQLSAHFTEEQLRTIAILAISAAFLLLIVQPLVVWAVFKHGNSSPTKRPRSKPILNRRYNPCQIDHDVDRNFKLF
jgi:uncharacterized Tic20 family protein